MAKHETPPDGSEENGKVPDEVDIAKLLTEPEGRHSTDDEKEEDEE